MRMAAVAIVLTSFGLSNADAASPAIVLFGKGVQIYECAQADAGYAWRLKAPEATLTDAAGQIAGRHFGGPSWQAQDGSRIIGNVLASSQSPQPDSIPWLVLGVKAHGGSGLFADVTHVVRTDTKGGMAPKDGCDAPHAGADIRVDYSATYTFFPG